MQTKEGRASLSMAKRKVSGVKKANAPPEVPTAAAATPADQDQRHGDSSTPAESKRKQQVWILQLILQCSLISLLISSNSSRMRKANLLLIITWYYY